MQQNQNPGSIAGPRLAKITVFGQFLRSRTVGLATDSGRAAFGLLTRRGPRGRGDPVGALPAGPPHVRPGGREGGARHLLALAPQQTSL